MSLRRISGPQYRRRRSLKMALYLDCCNRTHRKLDWLFFVLVFGGASFFCV